MTGIIKIQSEELTIFRTFETYARNKEMTEEIWTQFLDNMDAFRKKMQEENEAKAAAIVGKVAAAVPRSSS